MPASSIDYNRDNTIRWLIPVHDEGPLVPPAPQFHHCIVHNTKIPGPSLRPQLHATLRRPTSPFSLDCPKKNGHKDARHARRYFRTRMARCCRAITFVLLSPRFRDRNRHRCRPSQLLPLCAGRGRRHRLDCLVCPISATIEASDAASAIASFPGLHTAVDAWNSDAE